MILLTGAAGFIGYHTTRALLERGEEVIGIDNLNDYYDFSLKISRLKQLQDSNGFTFYKADISDFKSLEEIILQHPAIENIIHLAAQAGVRYSLENPFVYENSNIAGQLSMLEIARKLGENLRHFVYASSSSVYGGNTKQPFSVEDPVNEPVSLYAATKRAGELLVQSYSHLYGIPSTGLRFFTVYGPWGRPDMAYFSFTKAIDEGVPIRVFNYGDMKRDFTWIEDIIEGVLSALGAVPLKSGKYCIGDAPHRILNLGNNKTASLLEFISAIEKALGKKAEKIMEPMQPGDVYETYADIDASRDILGFYPDTPIDEGIPKFVEWYKAYKDQRSPLPCVPCR
jgi:UDP-glucuronate 4-epimerase